MNNYPKKIYLELTTIPACDFGCLWHEEKINDDDVAYILESEYIAMKEQYQQAINKLLELQLVIMKTEAK